MSKVGLALTFLLSFRRTRSIAEWVKELKRVSSLWMHEREGPNDAFQWQAGYGVFSVSKADLDQVIDYIRRQPEHHRQTTFQDELRLILRSHGIEFDERYLWQ